MRPWYVTREQVKRASEVKSTMRSDAQVDRLIGAASRDVEGDLHRTFYPVVATYDFPAPDGDILYLEFELDVDLVELDMLSVDGAAVDPADFQLLPLEGPPFTMIQFKERIVSSAKRPIEGAGIWGYDNVTAAAGQLAAAVPDATSTEVEVTDSAAVGVGDLLTVEAEKLMVADKVMLDTGQNLGGDLTASTADRTVAVQDGTAFAAGEVLLVDAEKMLITDIAGSQLVVLRAWDGSVPATHTAPVDIFAPRQLSVQRGALGTIAATHADGSGVARQVYDELVVAYAAALTQYWLRQEQAMQTGQDVSGAGAQVVLDEARRAARKALGRNR